MYAILVNSLPMRVWFFFTGKSEALFQFSEFLGIWWSCFILNWLLCAFLGHLPLGQTSVSDLSFPFENSLGLHAKASIKAPAFVPRVFVVVLRAVCLFVNQRDGHTHTHPTPSEREGDLSAIPWFTFQIGAAAMAGLRFRQNSHRMTVAQALSQTHH